MSNDGTGLRERVAKAIADHIGHGMAEKCEGHADAAIAALSAVAPPPVLEGWVLVPREPDEQLMQTVLGHGLGNPPVAALVEKAQKKWSAILAASPAAPAQPEGGEAVAYQWRRNGEPQGWIVGRPAARQFETAKDCAEVATWTVEYAYPRPALAQQAVTDEMVMRGARAIYENQGYPMGWDEADSYYRNTAISIARRALTAALTSNAAASAADAQEGV